MPFRVALILDGAVLDTAYSGDVTLDDVAGVTRECLALIATSAQPEVHLLSDFAQIRSQPKSVFGLLQASRGLAENPKRGWWVVWGIPNPFVQFIVRLLANIKTIRLQEVASREEALAFVETLIAAQKPAPE